MGTAGTEAYKRQAQEDGALPDDPEERKRLRMRRALAYFNAEPEEKAAAKERQQAARERGDLPAPRNQDAYTVGTALRRHERYVRDTILFEERFYAKSMDEKETLVTAEYDSVDELTGEELCALHHTHGVTPDMVEGILEGEIDNEVLAEYERAYAEHKQTGADGTH